MNSFCRGPQKSDLLELLTQIRQGKVSSNIFVRLERLQVLIEFSQQGKHSNPSIDFLQTAISSACIEHLDFLNNTLCTPVDWQLVAIHEHRNTSEIGQYKSLTDVTKAPIVVEDIDYNNHVDIHLLIS